MQFLTSSNNFSVEPVKQLADSDIISDSPKHIGYVRLVRFMGCSLVDHGPPRYVVDNTLSSNI